MPYIFITVTAKEALTKLAKKRKDDDSLIKTKVDVASEAIINASASERVMTHDETIKALKDKYGDSCCDVTTNQKDCKNENVEK